jgi:hypothetical protein
MAADADHGRQPVGQPVDPARADAGERGVQLRVLGVRRGEPQVVAEGPGEDVDLLHDERGGRVRMPLADPHVAAGRLEHAGHDPRKRRFPGAARPHHRDVLARRDVEVDVVEHRMAREVAVAENARDDRRTGPRGGVLRDGQLRDADEPPERAQRVLQVVEEEQQLPDRVEGAMEVQRGGGRGTHGDRAVGDEPVARREHRGEAHELGAVERGQEAGALQARGVHRDVGRVRGRCTDAPARPRCAAAAARR